MTTGAGNGGQEGFSCAPLVAYCDPTPGFQLAEHDLDAVAATISSLVVADSFAGRLPTGDAGRYPIVFQRTSQPVGVVTPICDHLVGSRQAAQQGGAPGVMANVTCGHEELQLTAFCVDESAQHAVQPALLRGRSSARSDPQIPIIWPQAGSYAVHLQIGQVYHDGLLIGAIGGQAFHHPGEGPYVTSPFPAVV